MRTKKPNWLKARVVVIVGLGFFLFPLDKNWGKSVKQFHTRKLVKTWKRKQSNLVFFFFSSPKCPFLKCVHHIFIYFFFPDDQATQKCFSLGLSTKSLIGPKLWCFVAQYSIFLRPATQSFGINQKKCLQFFAHLWSDRSSLLSYPFVLSHCGTSTFRGLVPSSLQLL